jgi:hypothetical protein
MRTLFGQHGLYVCNQYSGSMPGSFSLSQKDYFGSGFLKADFGSSPSKVGLVRIAVIDGVFYEPIWMQVQRMAVVSPLYQFSVIQRTSAHRFRTRTELS